MGLPYPACGNGQPHAPHPQLTADFGAPDCPGWTADQQAVRQVITSVRDYVREHYQPGDPLPDGLRLEMHPAVIRLLMMDQSLWEYPVREARPEDWFPVPVRATTDLGGVRWRLVIVTEELLLDSGTAPGA